MRPLEVRRLGVVPYATAVDLQRELVEQRKRGEIPDTLLLLQHPHVLTLGVSAARARPHIVASDGELDQLGVEIFESGRGGDVTYHGPGQLVGYPILDLKPDRQDVHRYVRDLEEVTIRTCAGFGIAAERLPGLSGAWTPEPAHGGALAKIAAIGVRISRWVTSHGFALNVNTNLDFFRLIVPCGITDRGVTSLAQLLGREQSLARVEAQVVQSFEHVFERSVVGDR